MRRRMGEYAASILATGQAGDPRSQPAVAGSEVTVSAIGELADQRGACTGGAPLHCCPDTPQQRNRFVGEECLRFTAAENCETSRLVELGGDLGEEFVVAQSDRHRDAERGFDADASPPR